MKTGIQLHQWRCVHLQWSRKCLKPYLTAYKRAGHVNHYLCCFPPGPPEDIRWRQEEEFKEVRIFRRSSYPTAIGTNYRQHPVAKTSDLTLVWAVLISIYGRSWGADNSYYRIDLWGKYAPHPVLLVGHWKRGTVSRRQSIMRCRSSGSLILLVASSSKIVLSISFNSFDIGRVLLMELRSFRYALKRGSPREARCHGFLAQVKFTRITPRLQISLGAQE